MSASFERTIFDTPRATEYFTIEELQAQTGQHDYEFFHLCFKELVNNALDAAESANVSPEIDITVILRDEVILLMVGDNGVGLNPEVIERILNFNYRTSDKAAYRSPTRGLQGNAFKTLIGMPYALGRVTPINIASGGIRHVIRAWVDPAGEVRTEHRQVPSPITSGTHISLPLPMREEEQVFDPLDWAADFALFNPYAVVQIRMIDKRGEQSQHADSDPAGIQKMYQSSVVLGDGWRKFLPTDATAIHWYDTKAFHQLVYSYIGVAERGGRDLPLREFVRQFRGLGRNAPAKLICDAFPEVRHLSDLTNRDAEIARLHKAMKVATKPPSENVLGLIGRDHLVANLDRRYGVKRSWYQKVAESPSSSRSPLLRPNGRGG
jgi:DNA topoisomerase VI subunit B